MFDKELENILYDLIKFANLIKFEKPYLVGGVARDLYLSKNSEGYKDLINDIDITNNSGRKSSIMGLMYAIENNIKFKYFDNNHLVLFKKDHSLDFSSGFVSKKVLNHYNNSIPKMLQEVYSRDFTANMLHIDIEKKEYIDYTRESIDDINNKIIRTIVPPEIVFSDDIQRTLRSIYFSSKLNFSIDSDILDYFDKNYDFIKSKLLENRSFFINIISKSLSHNEELTLKNMISSKVFFYTPLVGSFKNILIKRKLLDYYLRNNDEG